MICDNFGYPLRDDGLNSEQPGIAGLSTGRNNTADKIHRSQALLNIICTYIQSYG
jgi:hypothetical protein